MTLTTRMTLLLGLFAAQGCIVYEERVHHIPDLHCDSACTWDTGTDDEPGPVLTADLQLTVAEALPGENLLSTLVNVGSESLDLSGVEAVTFSRDVAVLDLMPREDEVLLLLSVHGESEPGAVDVSVTGKGDRGWILEQPFVILDPADNSDCTPGSGGTTTTDTACP